MERVGQDTLPSEASLPMIDGLGEIPADHPAAALLEPLIDSAPTVDALLAQLRWHQVSPAAASRVVEARQPELGDTAAWREAVERNREGGNDIARARALTESALLPVADRVALPPSTLGPLWVHDVDVLVRSGALEDVSRTLEDADFLDVNALLARIGRVTPGVRRFGATDAHEVLASVELCTRIHPLGPSADAAVERAPGSARGFLGWQIETWPSAAPSRLPPHGASRFGARSSCWRSSSGCRRSPGTRTSPWPSAAAPSSSEGWPARGP